jgi:undecaprenyl-phosphate galactose phosphotransferase
MSTIPAAPRLHAHKYLLALCDIMALVVAFHVSYMLRNELFAWRGDDYVATYRHAIFLAALMPLVLAYFRHCYLYRDLAFRPSSEHLEVLTRAWVVVVAVFITLSFFFKVQLFLEHRITVFLFLLLGWLGLYLGRFVVVPRLVRHRAFASGLVRRAVFVAPQDVATKLARRLATSTTLVTQGMGYLDSTPAATASALPHLGTPADLESVLRQHAAAEVFVDLPGVGWDAVQTLLDTARRNHVGARVALRHFGGLVGHGILLPDVEHGMVYLNDSAFLRVDRLVKRTVDVLVAGLGLIVLAPLLLVVALLVKSQSPGPVFFRQRRTGAGGRGFDIIKFRSMRQNTEDHHRKAVAEFMQAEADPAGEPADPDAMRKVVATTQVTPVGAFLRRTSLDELPQLINVLRGDMSLVGPRPEPEYQVALYKPWHHLRHRVCPGITGYWQNMGRSAVSHDDMVLMDVFYINNWSLSLDFRILAGTFFVVLTGKGAL